MSIRSKESAFNNHLRAHQASFFKVFCSKLSLSVLSIEKLLGRRSCLIILGREDTFVKLCNPSDIKQTQKVLKKLFVSFSLRPRTSRYVDARRMSYACHLISTSSSPFVFNHSSAMRCALFTML